MAIYCELVFSRNLKASSPKSREKEDLALRLGHSFPTDCTKMKTLINFDCNLVEFLRIWSCEKQGGRESESERQGPKQELTLSSNQAFFLLQPGLLWLRSFFFSQSSFFGHGPEEILLQRRCEIWPVLLSQHCPRLKTACACTILMDLIVHSKFSSSAQPMHCALLSNF